MSDSALNLSTRYNAHVAAGEKMIDSRIAGGSSYIESRALFAELCANHAGENLANALVYNGFATEAQARKYVGGMGA